MTHCWYELRIPIHNALKPEWSWPDTTKTRAFLIPIDKILKESWLDMMDRIGITIKDCLLLYKDPSMETKHAHVDLMVGNPEKSVRLSFNWSGNYCPDNTMQWFEMPAGDLKIGYIPSAMSNVDNIPYSEWKIDELIEIDHATISSDKLTMVKVDVPHCVSTPVNSRWGVCLRTNSYFKDWEHAVSFMMGKNLLINR